MAREISIVVTPGPGEIVQGQRADTKRLEADSVSAIAGLMSTTTQFAVVPEPRTDEERGRRDGARQALDLAGTPQSGSLGPTSVGGPDDPAFKDWQRGYDDGKRVVEGLFKR
jgi:hypothetical protein